ncbi:MAG: long-chain fatty acid--CoA ligase, partial [Clostridia bacterium]|nr:long-chain fatty acid--CoA ligase [Clostridia bacterium]
VYLVALVYPNRDSFPSGTPDEEIQSTIESKVQELNKHLVRYKQIRSVEFRDCEFEKTTSKKIKRFLLK